MKTTEQVNTEVLNYLTKTSQHLFTTVSGIKRRIFIEGDNYILMENDKVMYVRSISDRVKTYDGNTKCVIKHELFLVPSCDTIKIGDEYVKNKIVSIRQKRIDREFSSKISELIKGKTDKNEIKNLINVDEKPISKWFKF